MTSRMVAIVELVIAGVAAAACVLSWVSAGSTEVVAPVLAGEPSMSSTVYDPTMITLALIFAAVAGVLTVAGVGRLRARSRST